MPEIERINFAEAVSEPLLFATDFKKLSTPQRMIVKAIYGLPLTKDERVFWNAFNGYGTYDELGYLVDTYGEFPYEEGVEAEDVTLCVGRRSGKSQSVSALILAYEALCGGHQAYVGKKQAALILQVAQDLATARANLRQFVLGWLEGSPIGKKELGNYKSTVTADSIRLKQSLITVGPPSIKLRSQGIAIANLDELAFVATGKDAAAPDFEIERAVRPAMAQFPHRKIIKTSTPWIEEGLLWDALQIGTKGYKLPADKRGAYSKTIVLKAPTAAMGNPKLPKSYLVQELAKDPSAFRREYLAEASKSVSGFLKVELLRAAITKGISRRSPNPRYLHIAVLDPAFRRDAFAFCIGHLEHGRFVLDFSQAWRGTPQQPLSPMVAMSAIADVCRSYNAKFVYSDQYHLESLTELAQQVGMIIIPSPLTNMLKKTMWGGFESFLLQQKVDLLDLDDVITELAKMEKRLTPFGQVQFGGLHDDTATVIALCLHKCLEMGEAHQPTPKAAEDPFTKRIIDSIHKPKKTDNPWWAEA